LLFVVLWLLKDRPARPGAMVCLFLSGYGVSRFIAEFFRQPDPQIGLVFGLLSMGQILCLAMVLTAVILWRLLPDTSSEH
jgi:phosphatidylglycerol:prolipoprotein diacylglycerol transferase